MLEIGIATGHSKKDPGAIGIDGTKEYDLNVPLFKAVVKFKLDRAEWWRSDWNAEDLPYPTYLTKTILNCNSRKVLCALELHHNFVMNKTIRGGQIIYWDTSAKGHLLAHYISVCLNSLATPFTTYADFFKDYKSEKQIGRRLGFLTKTTMPAVIIEPGFISNAEDLKFVQDQRLQIAKGIADGVQNYINRVAQ